MSFKRIHVFISGRVQGVFFRAYTRDKAQALELTGWVKNCCDGSVEAVFEGEKEKLAQMLAWCYQGSPYSKVDNVQVNWQEYTGEFELFSITGW